MIPQDVVLTEVRCPHCGKLLFKSADSTAAIEVLCSSCKQLLYFVGLHFGQPIIFAIEEGSPRPNIK